jgi:hypothetical protein
MCAPRLSLLCIEVVHCNSLIVGSLKYVTVVLLLLTSIPASTHGLSLTLFLTLGPKSVHSSFVAHATFLDLLILKVNRAFIVKNFRTIFIGQLCSDLTLFLKVLVLIIAEILHVLRAISIVSKNPGLIFKVFL